jgi:hypothetical protein
MSLSLTSPTPNKRELGKYAPMLVIGMVLLMTGEAAFAQSADELGNGICRVVNLLTGKFLFGISVLSMVAGGAALLFGAELTDGVKKMVTIVTIVGMILSFGGILSMAYNALSSAGC